MSDLHASTETSGDDAVTTSARRPPPFPAAAARRPRGLGRHAQLLPYASAVVVTLYVCRGTLTGHYLGDVGDARWTVALHEHWLRVWQGQDTFPHLLYYVPLKAVLGTSDAFFVQGQIYAALRTVGMDLAPAWALTQLLFFLIGALGVAVMARLLLARVLSQSAFVVLVCSSYPLLVDIGHVQLIGVLSCSWVVVGVLDILGARRPLRGLVLVLLVPPLIALSSWYSVILLGVMLAFVGVYLLVLGDVRVGRQRLRHAWAGVASLFRQPPRLVALVGALGLSVALWGLTLWVYLPARNLLPKSTWLETTLYSPQLSDVLNAAWGGGGIWRDFYASNFDPLTYNFEQPRGFTPILFVAFLVLGLYNLRRAVAVKGGDGLPLLAGPRALTAFWLAVLSVVLFFIVDERDLGLFKPVFENAPGMDSIRAPFRVQTLTYALAFLILLRSAELLYDRLAQRAHNRVGAGGLTRSVASTAVLCATTILVALVLVEGHRPTIQSWTPQELLSPALVARIPEVQQRCDAVVVEPSGEDKVRPQIDAILLATLSGVVTPQGYGRAEPVGHPLWTAGGEELATWMRDQGYSGRICILPASPTGALRVV